jgi:hypothetical protein
MPVRLTSFLLIVFFYFLLLSSGNPSCGTSGGNVGGSGDGGGDSEPINTELFRPGPVEDEFPNIADIDFSALLSMPDTSFPVSGNTWHVATTGDHAAEGTESAPLRTILTALDRASPGDKIVIHEGTYEEGNFDVDFHAVPITKSDLVVTNATDEEVIITPAGEFTYGVGITGDNVILNGVTIQGFRTQGIELGAENDTLQNVILSNITVIQPDPTADFPVNGGIGSTVVNSDGAPTLNKILLENVVIANASEIGFGCNFGPCTNVRFNNVAVRNRNGGTESSGADCIAFEDGDNLVFFNVESTGCEADGLDLKADRVAVVNSYFHDIERNGLKLWRGGDVINTIVSHTGADASVIFDGPGEYRMVNSIVANHLEGTAGAYTMTVGFDTTCGEGSAADNFCCTTLLDPEECGLITVELSNNVFLNDSGPVFVPSGTGLNVRNNLFADFADGEQVFEVREVDARLTLTAVESNGGGSSNLPYDTDPRFTDAADEDWSAAAGSPLIDGGIESDPYPTFDFNGDTRTQGPAPDLGPIENR